MNVLISGAGIAGSTVAILLSNLGHQVTVLEKSSELLPHGQNVDIQGAAITAMKRLGLMDRIREMHTAEAGTRFVHASGEAYASFPQDGTAGSPTAEHEILRGDFAKLLYDAARANPNVTYLFNTTVEQILSNDEKAVRVRLSSGSISSFDMLIAADGQWSKLRSMIFDPEEVNMVDLNAYAAYWTLPRQAEDNDWWNVYFAQQSRIITIRPDPHGTVRAMFTCMPSSAAQKRLWSSVSRASRTEQQVMLHREFGDAGWQVRRLLDSMDEAPDFYFQKFQQVKMGTWSRGRVICLGDTAYCPTPLTGMGTSLAVIGAYVLAGEISNCTLAPGEVWDMGDILDAFTRYDAKFRPFVTKAQAVLPSILWLMYPPNLWRTRLVQLVVILVSWIVPFWCTSSGSAESDDDGFPLPMYERLIPGKESDCQVAGSKMSNTTRRNLVEDWKTM